MPVKRRAFIKLKGVLQPVDRKIKNTANVFLDIAKRVGCHDGHLILCKRIFFDHEMIDHDAGIGNAPRKRQ